MSYATQQFKCVDDELGTHLNFDNSSDALFARLFLKRGPLSWPLSWTFFDTILSTLRDPAFDVKQITFKDCADFHTRIAKIRESSLSSITQRESKVSSPIPYVVLEGVFQVLGDDLRAFVDTVRSENNGHITIGILKNSRLFSEEFKSRQATLAICARVHSSWLERARHQLGSCHISTPSLLPRSLRNPWLGGWTRDLHISYCNVGPDPRTPQSHALLRALLARLPNVQHLSLCTKGYKKAELESFTSVWADIFPFLPQLEELTFHLSGIDAKLVQLLSEAPLKKLKSSAFWKGWKWWTR